MVAVNLLPWRQQRAAQQRRQSLAVLAGVAISLMLVGILQVWRINRMQQQVTAETARVQAALDDLIVRLARQKTLLDQLAAQQQQRKKQQQQVMLRAAWQQFWLDLPMLLPDTAWLNRLEKRGSQLSLEGQAEDMQAIGQFRQRLTAVSLFRRVEQGSVRRQPGGGYHFTLRAQLQEPGHE